MKYLLLTYLIFSSFFSFAQETIWNTNIESIRSYSSPRPTNINNDNTLDIVFGGGVEGYPTPFGVNAVDGFSGEVLWTMPTRNEMFGSPNFIDVNNDGIDDVIIAGRDAELRMINGQDGSLIWEFWEYASFPVDDPQYINPNDSGWYNFYNIQIIDDLNNDGIDELLCSNGGDHSLDDIETNRPPGHILIVDSYSGNTLFSSVVPDSNETYMSPLLVDLDNSGDKKIIFGTGGETIGGSLFICSFEDLLNNDLSNSTTLITSELGIIGPPSLGDLNNDNIFDIVVQSFDGTITAINGYNYEIIWQVNLGGVESSVSPTLGLFSGEDNNIDVFCINYVGQQSSYNDFYQILIDGENGDILYLDSISDFNFSSAVAFDHNNDGKDEVLISTTNIGESFSHDLILIDFINDTTTLLNTNNGGDVWSTPLIYDLDADNLLDIVFITQNDNPFVSSGISVSRLSSNYLGPNQGVSWGSYMGTNYNSQFERFYGICSVDLGLFLIPSVSCPGQNSGSIDLITPSGQGPFTYSWSNGSVGQDLDSLSSGNYTVIVSDANGCQDTASTFVGEYNTTFATNNPTCFGASDGSIYFSSSGCSCNSSNCQFIWSANDSIILEGDGSSSLQTHKWLNNVGAGIYTATIIHPNGCQIQQEFILSDPIDSDTITACESYEWNDSLYTNSGMYIYNYYGSQNNSSMSFDGADGYLNCGSLLNDPGENGAIFLTFKLSNDFSSSNSERISLIDKYNNLNDAPIDLRLDHNEGKLCWRIQPLDLVPNGWEYVYSTTTYWNANQWYNIAVSWGVDGMKMYVDGILEGTNASTIKPGTSTSDLLVGADYNWSGLATTSDLNHYFEGVIDNLHIWETPLNQEQVQMFMNCPPIGDEQGLLFYLNFEEGEGTTVIDQVNNDVNEIINGANYTTDAPIQSCQLLTENGCDSIAILNLIINESTISYDTVVACDSYTWTDGVSYSESGNYSYEGINASGCSETNFLSLIINESTFSYDTIVGCDSYTWVDGITYTESGYYSLEEINATGCLETNTLLLTINESTISNDTVVACDSYLWIDGITYTESGDYTFEGLNSSGCPETNTLTLTINESTISNDTVISCNEYEWNGFIYNESGDYSFDVLSLNGCDSVANLNLTVSNLEPIAIEGLLVGFVETSDNIYSIENPIYGSVYHWTLSEQLGEIAYSNNDSSQISINWGSQDDYAILCVYEEDQFGCIGTETCIEIDLKSPNSIYDNEPILLNIYPNPFTNEAIVSFSNPNQEETTVQLIDSRGRLLREYNDIRKDMLVIKKENLSNGLYYINLIFDNQKYKGKIIIY